MREIRFRGWYTNALCSYMLSPEFHGPINEIFNDTENKGRVVYMQYTGLKDKNSHEIYEGDVLKDRGDEGPVYVEWSQEYGGFVFVDKFDPSGIVLYSPREIYYEQFEVIGNIYENPELLEEGFDGKGES